MWFHLNCRLDTGKEGKLRLICVGGALMSALLPYQTRKIESDEKAAAEISLC